MTEPAAPTQSPRLLVPVTIHFAVRYLVRTGLLDLLRSSCQPVLALSWDDPALCDELTALGFEVTRLPTAEMSPATHLALADLEASFARRLASPSTSIDRSRRRLDHRARTRLRRWVQWQRLRLRSMRPGAEERACARLAAVLPHGTNLAENEAFLADQRIDAVFSVTPFVVQELVMLHAAERQGLPRATSILSFDNITTRPPLPVTFDRYVVWNRLNAAEIIRGYPTVEAHRITATGPAQFDFYSEPSYVQDEPTWRRGLGLAPGHPTILYGAGPPAVSPHEDQYVDDLVAAIGRGEFPRDLRIVVRRHPNDLPDRWDRFRAEPAVAFDDPGALGPDRYRLGQVNLQRQQIVDLCSSLAHTDVHVSVSSTMTLDGACYDKPQIGPAYDRRGGRRHRRRAQDLYAREHFLPIVASGGLELVTSPADLARAVRQALIDPGRRRAERQAMLATVCTHTDGRCTERVAEQIRSFIDTLPATTT